MFEIFTPFLTIVGLVSIIIILGFSIYVAAGSITSYIRKCLYRYTIKHRFKKKPMADCYCKDCIFFNSNNSSCDRYSDNNDFYIPESGFCYFAHPINYKQKEKHKNDSK